MGKERERERERKRGGLTGEREKHAQKELRRTDPLKQTVQSDLFILIFISIKFSKISEFI